MLQIADKRFFQRIGVLAAAQFFRFAHGQHAAAVHQRDAVAAGGFVHEVGGDENGYALFPRHAEQVLPKHIARGGIDAGGGLVQNQHLRAVQAGGGQLQALAHAQGQGGGGGVGQVGQFELAQHGFDGGIALFAQPVQPCVQHQVLPHAQLFIQRKRLRHITHALAHGGAACVYRLAQECGFAFAGVQEAGEHFHGGAFAAAVGAEKAENFALADAEAHVVYRREVAEAFAEVVRLHRGRQGIVGDEGRQLGVVPMGLLAFGQHFDIGLLQRGAAALREDFLRVAVGEDLAVVHGQQLLELFGFVDVGGGHQHGHAGVFGAQFAHQCPELAAGKRVDAGGGFVQNQQVGVVHQGAAQAEFLLHAAGELAGGAAGKGRQAGGLHQALDVLLALVFVQAEQAGVEINVFIHRQRGVEIFAQALRHKGNARQQRFAFGLVRHLVPEHAHFTALERAHAGNQRKQGGFAHAVGAD